MRGNNLEIVRQRLEDRLIALCDKAPEPKAHDSCSPFGLEDAWICTIGQYLIDTGQVAAVAALAQMVEG